MIERRLLIRDQFIHMKDTGEVDLPVIVFTWFYRFKCNLG